MLALKMFIIFSRVIRRVLIQEAPREVWGEEHDITRRGDSPGQGT